MTVVSRATWPQAVAARLGAPLEHLYVHMPFCRQLCPYCDFNSYAGRDAEIDPYLDALGAELEAWSPWLRPTTVFVGGGTPTHGRNEVVARQAEVIGRHVRGPHLLEWTVEANPGTLEIAKVEALLAAGVNRISLGAQSFHPAHLATLGRAHGPADTVRAIEILRRAGMPRVSLDLIVAIPGQTLGEQRADARRVVDLSPDHVSAYVLTYEPGTAFTRAWEEGRLPGPDPDRELAHLDATAEILEAAGLARYEISNFATPGNESLHNLVYWRNASWVAVGAGGHGHVAGMRWKLEDDPARYVARVRAGEVPVSFQEVVDAEAQAVEHLLMGLRLSEGVDLELVRQRTGIDVAATRARALAALDAQGLLQRRGTRLVATPLGRNVLDTVLGQLAEPEA
ncbi:MAG: radical SAM family heme chaperone HemW [Planctomycetota bacterium]